MGRHFEPHPKYAGVLVARPPEHRYIRKVTVSQTAPARGTNITYVDITPKSGSKKVTIAIPHRDPANVSIAGCSQGMQLAWAERARLLLNSDGSSQLGALAKTLEQHGTLRRGGKLAYREPARGARPARQPQRPLSRSKRFLQWLGQVRAALSPPELQGSTGVI